MNFISIISSFEQGFIHFATQKPLHPTNHESQDSFLFFHIIEGKKISSKVRLIRSYVNTSYFLHIFKRFIGVCLKGHAIISLNVRLLSQDIRSILNVQHRMINSIAIFQTKCTPFYVAFFRCTNNAAILLIQCKLVVAICSVFIVMSEIILNKSIHIALTFLMCPNSIHMHLFFFAFCCINPVD